MNLQQKTPPTAALLDLAEAKGHLKVEFGRDDALIQGLVDAVHRHLEGPSGILGRTLLRQTWIARADRWPCAGENVGGVLSTHRWACSGALEVPLPPLISVDAVRYRDTNGVQQTWANTNYEVEINGTAPALIGPAYGVVWPTIRRMADAVEVEFAAGYGGPESVPENILLAAKLMLTHWYDNRATVATQQAYEIPMAARYLLDPIRMISL